MEYDKIINNLTKRGFDTHFVESRAEAVKLAQWLITEKSFVVFGGSVTVKQLNLHNALNGGGRIIKHTDFAQNMAKRYDGDGDKWFVSSTNAITQDGQLVNIDGHANRISGMIYNNPNVLIVCGVNKIVNTLDDAIYRVRNVAAPPNAVRLNRKTPCATTGKCHDCYCADCMCNATLIQHHPTRGVKFHIILINESLGY